MTPSGLVVIAGTAASIGFLHTLLGPDHYVPFIALARSGRWSLRKTALVTFLCGIGHVGSSVVLGFAGIALGAAVTRIKAIEASRGNIAAWVLIAFGLVYFAWGLRRGIRSREHTHAHRHGAEAEHEHAHTHNTGHMHVHAGSNPTPWILFTIFVFGPCEPLIPLVMYPAAQHNMAGVAIVAGVFGSTTIATMLVVVLASTFGFKLLPTRKLERYSHALAGLAIFLCGIAVQFLHL
jgi:sulfite exporter TauE/SafE